MTDTHTCIANWDNLFPFVIHHSLIRPYSVDIYIFKNILNLRMKVGIYMHVCIYRCMHELFFWPTIKKWLLCAPTSSLPDTHVTGLPKAATYANNGKERFSLSIDKFINKLITRAPMPKFTGSICWGLFLRAVRHLQVLGWPLVDLYRQIKKLCKMMGYSASCELW